MKDYSKTVNCEFSFSRENLKRAKKIIKKYPKGKQSSACMPLLDLAQRQNNGWLSQIAIDYVAEFLDMVPMEVYEVATFYTMFNLKPIGRQHVQVCTNLPCWLRGSDKIVDSCKKIIGVDFGATSQDGVFTLSEVECLGACVNAPVVQVNDDYYEDLSPQSIEEILQLLRIGNKPKPGSQIGRNTCEPSNGLTSLKEDGG